MNMCVSVYVCSLEYDEMRCRKVNLLLKDVFFIRL